MAVGLSRRLDAAHGISGRENRNTLMRTQVEQIEIARDDEIGARGECAGEHVIIVGVAAGRCRQRLRLDQVSEPAVFLDVLGGG